ncbi:uncharacterized protein LOC108850565 [Raphanus sativus]|uniref:Uncharacterized protein LOC108850565 n=1 Tax=Raphanus sativus TaxID=3726 RepID=A0A9W3CH65_RAPSA|nr:uncharacterized protein LOC108850565 [Raphanus sativus]
MVETGITIPGMKRQDRRDETGKHIPGVKRQDRRDETGKHISGVKRCMNLRSRGSSTLAPIVEDISALEREIVRRRREEEQQAHIQRLGFDMENLPQNRAAEDGQGAANLGPRHPQRQARAIGAHDQPNIHGNRARIRAPAVENNNFEIESSLINMIQSNKYHGLALEDPLDHLDNFNRLCGTIKINTKKTKKDIKSLQDKKEPNFQYNNYQPRSYQNNQQGGYQPKQTTQQGNYQQRQNVPPGFGNTNQSTQAQGSSSQSKAPDSNMESMFKQIMEAQSRVAKDIGHEFKTVHSKIDSSYTELNNKIRALESQFASMNSQPSRQQGTLPGKPEQNPKETMKAITLRSGKELPPRVLTKDGEKQGGEVAINIDDEVVIVDEKVDEEILEKIVEAKGKGKVGEEKRTVKQGGATSKDTSFVPPPYEPKLPFPGRFKKQLLEKYKALFEKQMSEVQITMPIIDTFMLVPQYSKILKDAVAAKKKEMEGMVVLTHECSAIIKRLTIPKKLEDPGSFTLPCAIGPLMFERCLSDLGASVSLRSVAKKLGFSHYKKCKLSLVLADRSVKFPIGILEDLPVMVGNCEIPTDFVVLEMDEEARDPLILGRPFLATAGEIINVKEGKIDLHLGKEHILHFDINEIMKRPTIQGQIFYIEEMEALADELLEELALEDPLQHALTVDRGVQVVENKESDAYGRMLDSL